MTLNHLGTCPGEDLQTLSSFKTKLRLSEIIQGSAGRLEPALRDVGEVGLTALPKQVGRIFRAKVPKYQMPLQQLVLETLRDKV